MNDKSPSPRHQLAQRIANFILESRLANPFGGEVTQHGRYYSVLMSIPRSLDGEVRIYGPKFIHVRLVGPLSHIGSDFVFESEANALAFLKAWLVDFDSEAALAIPVKA